MRPCYPVLLSVLIAACSPDPRTPSPSKPEVGFQVPDAEVMDVPDNDSDVMELDDVDPDVATDDLKEPEDKGPGGPDEGPPIGDGTVGSSCFLDDQCEGDALCLDWLEGYCTHVNCPVVAECPAGSGCVDLIGGTTVCLSQCETASDCRPGYGCKPFVGVGGGVIQGCVGLNPEAAPAGGACQEHTDCEGSFACLGFVPGGYCALIGCSESEPCPEGTGCVTYNGQPTCLRTCEETEDCLVGGAEERICGPLLDLANKVADVCIPSVDGEGVGSQCSADLECDSNECRIVAEGKCTGQSLGCITDEDCPGAGVCELAPAYVKGICSQACTTDVACPGSTLCISTGADISWCQLACNGAGDVQHCEKSLGETCIFGDPLVDPTGMGKYACVVVGVTDPGMECTEDADCKGGGCLGAPGTCSPPCGEDLNCAFPTTCVEYEGAPRCLRRCFSVVDCPGDMACKTTADSFSKICVPK